MARDVDSSTRDDRFSVECPHCHAELRVDASTGSVLDHRAPSTPRPDFDALLEGIDADRERAERVFAREQKAHAEREQVLERRYAEALERASAVDDTTPPPSPFDLD